MRPLILRRRLASLLPPRLSVKLAAALGALVLVCIGIWLVNKAPAKKERAR